MRYKRLGIDLDGVLADFIKRMVQIMRKDVGIDLPPNFQPDGWNWINANLPPDAMKKAWKVIDSDPDFWNDLEPLPDINIMRECFLHHADDWDFYFITARDNLNEGLSAKRQSEQWLKFWIGQNKLSPFDLPQISVLTVKSGMDKAEIIYSLKIDYFIDDHTPTVCTVKSLIGNRACLMDRPWNQDGRSYGLTIVRSLEEFFDKVEND